MPKTFFQYKINKYK